eukprot:4730077-Amphidinium_carterae.1
MQRGRAGAGGAGLECVGSWTSLLHCSSAARRLRAGLRAEKESNKRREMDGSESTEKEEYQQNPNAISCASDELLLDSTFASEEKQC